VTDAELGEPQNDSHDWLGDAGESLVRYIAARDGLHVYGGGKWTADAAVHDPETKRWWRIEVRTTDRARRPTPKSSAKLAAHADILVEVRFKEDLSVELLFVKLESGRRTGARLGHPKPGEFTKWLRASGDAKG